jgi:hypothetical protein
VAPHRLEIENDKALFGRGTGEQIVAPFAPFDAILCVAGSGRERGNGEGGNADEFHGGSRKRWCFDSYGRAEIRAQSFRDVTAL